MKTIFSFPKLQSLMVKRFITLLILALSFFAPNSTEQLKAQVTFGFSPNAAPAGLVAGDTLRVNAVVSNFANVRAFFFAMEYTPDLRLVRIDNRNIPDADQMNINEAINPAILGWNISNSGPVTLANGTAIFRLVFVVVNPSTNFWARFRDADGTTEVVLQPGGEQVPLFTSFGNPPAPGFEPVVVKVNSLTTQSGQSLCLGVTADNFKDLTLAKWQMKWDSTILRFESLQNLNTTLGLANTNFTTTQAVANGRLNFNFTSTTARTVTNTDTLYKVCFTAIGANGTSSTVAPLSAGAEIFRDNGGSLTGVNLTPNPGTVNIAAAPDTNLTFGANNITGKVGDIVCVKIYGRNFTNIASFQSSLHWDSTRMSFVSARGLHPFFNNESLGVPVNATDTSSVKTLFRYLTNASGTLRFFWFDLNNPNTLTADSTVLAEVCLRINSGAGTTAPFTFDRIPLRLSALQDLGGGNTKTILPPTLKVVNATITIDNAQVPNIVASGVATNVSCPGGSDGKIDLTVSGGNGTFAYTWSGPGLNAPTTKDLSGLKEGKYFVTITSGDAPAKIDSFTITQPAALTIGAPVVTNAKCNGEASGSITISAAGGTPGYTYAWVGTNFNAATQNISQLKAGSYTLTVKDSKNCEIASNAIVVGEPAAITFTPSVSNADCNQKNGAINISVAGGSAPYTFAWSGTDNINPTTEDITGLGAGSYTVVVTDNAGCKFTSTPIAVSVNNPSFSVSVANAQNIKCNGGQDGAISLTVNGTGTYTYAWSGPNGPAGTTKDITNLRAGSYTVTVTDNTNCPIVPNAVTLTQPATPLSIGAQPVVTNVKCFGETNGSIIIAVAGGTAPYTFAWSGSPSTQQNLTGVGAGTYKVTVTDANNCTVVSPDFTITQPAAAFTVTENVTIAANRCNGAIQLNVAGGTSPYSYAWTGQGVNATAKDQANLCTGTYNVTVTDANGCTLARRIEVTGTNALPIRVTDSSVVNAGCPGQNKGEILITVAGGAAPLSFEWLTVPAGTVIRRDEDAKNLAGGTYRLRITDAVGQIYTTADFVVAASTSDITISNTTANETCAGNDGSINLTVSGGAPTYRFRWSDINPEIEDRTGIKAGRYSVIVTDANNCIAERKDIEVKRTPCQLSANLIDKKDVVCNGEDNGSITVNISNGEPSYMIKWSNNDSAQINTTPRRDGVYKIEKLKAGSYTITVFDGQGQSIPLNITINQPEAFKVDTVEVKADTGNCSGRIVLRVTGGTPQYSYSWNDIGQGPRDRFDLCGDKTYSVTVTDGNKCFKSVENIRINRVIPEFKIASVAISNPVCPEDIVGARIDITVEGGVKPYTYEWSDAINGIISREEDLLRVKVGKYTVTVTDNSPSPRKIFGGTYEVKATNDLAIGDVTTSFATRTDTADGGATLTISGGLAPYTVTWCGNRVQNTNDKTVTRRDFLAGMCSVTVRDSRGCTVTRNFDIKAGACANVRVNTIFDGGFNVRCFGDATGSATVTAVNDTAIGLTYTVRWNSQEVGASAFKLKGGNNTVNIVGANGKTCTASFVVKEPGEVRVTVAEDAKDCTLEARPVGGVAPFEIRWFRGDTTAKISKIQPKQQQIVTIKDKNGCSATGGGTAFCGGDDFCLKGRPVLTLADNTDNRNDEFVIERCAFPTVKLQVFNRWGQMVYENQNYTDQWKGNTRDNTDGEPLVEGVYFYVLKGIEANGKETVEKGTVTILR